jgi:hypothetical protein
VFGVGVTVLRVVVGSVAFIEGSDFIRVLLDMGR